MLWKLRNRTKKRKKLLKLIEGGADEKTFDQKRQKQLL